MEIKGLCEDCLFLKQEWTVFEDKKGQLKKEVDWCCSICDIFKRTRWILRYVLGEEMNELGDFWYWNRRLTDEYGYSVIDPDGWDRKHRAALTKQSLGTCSL